MRTTQKVVLIRRNNIYKGVQRAVQDQSKLLSVCVLESEALPPQLGVLTC
jgi:hypothetical protein